MKTHVAILVDTSGSMHSIRQAALKALNENIRTIRETATANTTVSLVTFGDRVQEQFFRADSRTLKPWESFPCSGGTPMLDAVGKTIQKFLDMPDSLDEDTSYLIEIVTDGEENASFNYSAAALRELMQKVNKTDRWTFAFQVPRGHAQRLCSQFGIPSGNVIEWDATERGAVAASYTTQRSTQQYFTARAAGARSTKVFFETDASKITPEQARTKLVDITNSVKVMKVQEEAPIREFFEEKTKKPYAVGGCYYQLTKDETVQHHKRVLLMEKGKNTVYGDARDVLGMSADLDVKVRPGNHANWDIFVQSTSTNRKLVRGTKLVWVK